MKVIEHINRYVSKVEKFICFYQDVLDYKLIDKDLKANGKNYAILREMDMNYLNEKSRNLF